MLEWYVYVENFNKKTIEPYNVFYHLRFLEDCKKNAKKNIHDYDAFCDTLRKDMMYYFWSKCEWEVVIDSWPPRDGVAIKIDVYDQVKLNWEKFCDYVWKHGVELRRKEKKVVPKEVHNSGQGVNNG